MSEERECPTTNTAAFRAWQVRKISKEDRGEATETRKLGVWGVGAREEAWSAVPQTQQVGEREGRERAIGSGSAVGVTVSWRRAVSVACGVKSAWNWLKGEWGEKS